jgi:hypothetical protein
MVLRVTVDQSVPGAQKPERTDRTAEITVPIRLRSATGGWEPDPDDQDPDDPGRESTDARVPVFVDPSGRRGRRIRVACYAGSAICLGYLLLVGLSMAGGAAGPRALLPFAILGGKVAPGHVGGPDGATRPHGRPAVTRGPARDRVARVATATSGQVPARAVPPSVPVGGALATGTASAGTPSTTPPVPSRSSVLEATTTARPTPTPNASERPTPQPAPQATRLPGAQATGRESTARVRPQVLAAAPPEPSPRSRQATDVPAPATASSPAAGPRL